MIFFITISVLMILFLYKITNINDLSKNIGLVYTLFVGIILILSTFNLFNMYEVSDKTYFLWLINIFLFSLSFIIMSYKKKIKILNKKEYINNFKKLYGSKLLKIFEICLMIILIYYNVKYKNVISHLDISQIRLARFQSLFDSLYETIFYNYIVFGAMEISMILSSIILVNYGAKNSLFVMSLINMYLYISIGYGRVIIYEYFIFIILAYIVKYFDINKKIKINFKKVFIIIILIVLIFSIGSFITGIRLGINEFNLVKLSESAEEQFKQIIIYFNGGFRALDNFLENGFSNIDNLTIGRATFGGIDEIVGYIFNVFGFKYDIFNNIIGTETQKNIFIGYGIEFNAFYTCIMDYYTDLGFLGVIIFPTIYGAFVAYCVNNYIKMKNNISILLLLFVWINTFSTVYKWYYQSGATDFLIIILIILNNINIKKELKNENTLDSEYNISLSS